jgi:hypothetical protein
LKRSPSWPPIEKQNQKDHHNHMWLGFRDMFSYNWKEDQQNDDQIDKQNQEGHHNPLQLGFRGLSNQN